MKSHLKNLIQINGTISISQFMNEALFHPHLGYYQQQNPFGRDGDFITAPEISQVFGELIGAYFVGLWQSNYQEKKVHLVEMGAGRGTLMKDLLAFAQKIPNFSTMVNVSIIEISPRLQEIQKQNLHGFKVDWYKNFTDFYQQNNDAPILFVANELFDCFAIDQFVKTENGWAEKVVGISDDGELNFALTNTIFNCDLAIKMQTNQELSQYKTTSQEGILHNDKLPIADRKLGDIFEHSPQAMSFMNELSGAIKRNNGVGLIIDYGYIQSEFQNTLQAIKNHQYVDVLKEAGSCDITALVDFSNLQKIAQTNNLQTSLITQKEFLNSLGIASRREKLLNEKNPQQQNQINSAINRLIDEKQMGELFKALVIW